MTYTNLNAAAKKVFHLETKHGEIRIFFWLLYLNLCLVMKFSYAKHQKNISAPIKVELLLQKPHPFICQRSVISTKGENQGN